MAIRVHAFPESGIPFKVESFKCTEEGLSGPKCICNLHKV